MRLFRLLRRESPVSLGRIAGMAAASGFLNAALLGVINYPGREDVRLALFAVAIVLFILAQRYILVSSTVLVETVLNRIRQRLSARIRNADLYPLEQVGRAAVYTNLSKQIVTISGAASTIIIAIQSSIMVAFAILCLAIISRNAFFLTLLLSAVALSIHFRAVAELQQSFTRAAEQETEYFELLTGLLEGFKEVKLNEARGDDLLHEMNDTSEGVARLKVATGIRFSNHFIFSQSVFYVLIAAIVFVLPRLNPGEAGRVTPAAATILFIIGPLSNVIGALPTLGAADVAVMTIESLESVLTRAESAVRAPALRTHPRAAFESIRLDGVVYRYTDAAGEPLFTLGPIDLTISRGEKIFIVGGNGSGKSTFLKVLTSLYYPSEGRILLDDRPLDESMYPEYRSLFSPIFGDYHLFRTLYGFRPVDRERVRYLLRMLEIEGKTDVEGDRFTTIELSTGQRKRLALAISYLEDRPIQIFDEWAADQDPLFRRYFYETLLSGMAEAGKTIVAATHDDRYFHVADRVLRMENGRFVAEEAPAHV